MGFSPCQRLKAHQNPRQSGTAEAMPWYEPYSAEGRASGVSFPLVDQRPMRTPGRLRNGETSVVLDCWMKNLGDFGLRFPFFSVSKPAQSGAEGMSPW